MNLSMAIWKQDTGVAAGVWAWAGQIVCNGQPATVKTPVNQSDLGCCPVRVSSPGELSLLTEMLLADWRAAEAHIT